MVKQLQRTWGLWAHGLAILWKIKVLRYGLSTCRQQTRPRAPESLFPTSNSSTQNCLSVRRVEVWIISARKLLFATVCSISGNSILGVHYILFIRKGFTSRARCFWIRSCKFWYLDRCTFEFGWVGFFSQGGVFQRGWGFSARVGFFRHNRGGLCQNTIFRVLSGKKPSSV